MIKIINWIAKDPKGIAWWSKWYLAIGVLISIIVGLFTWESHLTTFAVVVSIGGYACVYYLGLRKNVGNILGLIVNVGEGFIQFQYHAFGLAVAPIYYFVTHAYGFVTWNKNKDKDDKAILNEDKKAAYLSFCLFSVVGSMILFYLYQQNYFDGLSLVFLILNIVGMLVGIISQGLMIMRFKVAWWGWFVANIVWLAINLMTGNWVYFFQTIWYQVNVLITLYDQYTLK